MESERRKGEERRKSKDRRLDSHTVLAPDQRDRSDRRKADERRKDATPATDQP